MTDMHDPYPELPPIPADSAWSMRRSTTCGFTCGSPRELRAVPVGAPRGRDAK